MGRCHNEVLTFPRPDDDQMSLEILATLASSSLKAAFKDYVTDPWNAMDIAVLVLSWW